MGSLGLVARVVAFLRSFWVGENPDSPAGEINTKDHSAAVRTALLILLAGGIPAAFDYLVHAGYGLQIAAGLSVLGYLADLLRRKAKAYFPGVRPGEYLEEGPHVLHLVGNYAELDGQKVATLEACCSCRCESGVCPCCGRSVAPLRDEAGPDVIRLRHDAAVANRVDLSGLQLSPLEDEPVRPGRFSEAPGDRD